MATSNQQRHENVNHRTLGNIQIGSLLVRDHPKLMHLLARDLDACNVAVSDWRSLGSRLGLPFDDIMSYENCDSPTTAMLRELSTRYSIRIGDLMLAFRDMGYVKGFNTIVQYDQELQEPSKPIVIIIHSPDCETTALGLRSNILKDCCNVDVELLVYDNGFAIYDTNRRILETAETIVFVCSQRNLGLYRAHHPMHYLSSISQSSNYNVQMTVDDQIQINRSRKPRFEFLLCNGACPQDFMEVFGVRCYTLQCEMEKLIRYINPIKVNRAPAIGSIIRPKQIQEL